MEREQIIETLNTILCEKLSPRVEIELTSLIKEDLGADSLDEIELLMAVEDEYDIEITDEEGQKMLKVIDVVDFLEKRI
jgi:acyl carrier protein